LLETWRAEIFDKLAMAATVTVADAAGAATPTEVEADKHGQERGVGEAASSRTWTGGLTSTTGAAAIAAAATGAAAAVAVDGGGGREEAAVSTKEDNNYINLL
jgi:hypothetical protein